MNLRELKSDGFLVSEDLALATLNRDREMEKKMPWVARAALGIGAWLAGIFFTGFIGILLDFDEELPMAIIGLALTAGSVFLLRQEKGFFLEQLALALGFSGHLLFFFGLHEVRTNDDLFGPFLGALILCGPVYWFSKNPVQRFLSVLWIWMTGWIATIDGIWESDGQINLLIFGALAVALAVLSGWRKAAGPVWRPAMWASVAGLFGMLLWYTTGVAGEFGDHRIGPVFGVVAAMAISGVLWHLVRPEGKAAAGFGALVLVLIGLGVAGAPGVVIFLGLMVIARVRSDRHLGWIAILGLGQFLIAFYYRLDVPLIQKSIILMATGVIFLGFRWVLFRGGNEGESLRTAGSVSGVKGGIFGTVVIIANCLLVLLVVNGAIAKKQRTVETGRTVFLQLAPVDPRSLMQGDYMALRYALARDKDFQGKMKDAPTRGQIIVKLDDQNVASFSRSAEGEAALGENEALLSYRKWRRGWRFGIESFFFQEGMADVYNSAKYAELRLSPAGEAVLFDLRGGKLETLTSGGQPDDIPDSVESEDP